MNAFIERKLNENLEDNLVVDSYDAKSYDKWVTNVDNDDIPPAYVNYYLWNLTNLDEILKGANPIVQEIGPFRYRKYFEKEDVVFLDDGNKVSCRENKYFVAEGESESLDVMVTALNPAYMILVAQAGSEQKLLAGMTGGVFSKLITQLQDTTAALATAQGSALMMGLGKDSYLQEGLTEAQFCEFWANYTEAPPGFETWGILSIENIPSGITLEQCSSLLSGNPYSMTDSNPNTGIALWGTFDLGNATSIATVQQLFRLDSYQVQLLSVWRKSFQIANVNALVLARFRKFGVTQSSDLGLVQWGQGQVLNGQSLGVLANLAGIPEIYFWQTLVVGITTPVVFNLTQTQQLLFGPYGLTNLTNYQTFLTLASNGNIATIQQLWGLTVQEATTITQYFLYIGQTFTKPLFLAEINKGSGLFVTKSAQEWLWNGTDPLLALFGGARGSDYHLIHNNSIETNPSTFYTGKDDLDRIAEYIEYEGESVYCGVSTCGSEGTWQADMKVGGTTGRNNKPKMNTNYVPIVWSSDFLRPVTFKFDQTDKIHGVEVYKFLIDQEVFAPDPNYYQSIRGFGNLTHVSGAPVFVSQAHMYGVDEKYQDKITGQDTSEDPRIYISIEPFTGSAFKNIKKVQLNGYIEPQTQKYSLFYPNIPTDIFIPLVHTDDEGEISESAANDFKHSYYDTLTYQKVALWGGISVGLAVVIAGLVVLFRVVQRSKSLLDTGYNPLDEAEARA